MRTHHEAEEPNPGGQTLDQGLREHAAGFSHLVLEGDEGEGEEEHDGEGDGSGAFLLRYSTPPTAVWAVSAARMFDGWLASRDAAESTVLWRVTVVDTSTMFPGRHSAAS